MNRTCPNVLGVSFTSTKERLMIVPYHAMMARTLVFTGSLTSLTASVP